FDHSSNSQGVSVDASKRKQSILEDEEDLNGPELGPKRMRYSSVNQFPQPSLMQDSDHSSTNGASTNAPFLNDSLTPAEKMIAMIGAFLCEGERGAESLELLISQMHPDLLADIVITNMKHLPKAPPSSKLENLPRVVQNGSIDARQVAPAASTPAHGLVPATPDAYVSATPASASPTDLSASTNHSADPRRGPRRDPRLLDPRRMIAPVEVSSLQLTEQTTSTQFVFDAPASDKPLPCAVANTEDNSRSSVSKLESDGNITENSSIGETDQVMGKAVVPEVAKETPCSPDSDMTIENKPCFVLVDNETISQNMPVIETRDQEDVPSLLDSDEQSPTVSDIPATEETHKDLPEVPSYVESSDDQHNAMRNFAIEQFVQSYKYLERVDHSQTTLVLVSRLVSQMGAEQTESLVKEEIISNYKHKQGHELVILVLYHLYSMVKSESSDQSLLADAYDKFFVDVAKALLGKFPTTDKSFSRLLSEAPILPNSVLEVLDNLCSSDGYEQLREDDRDSDRVSQGLGTVWALILGRPVNRDACLNIALKCTVHQNEVIRKKAIRLVANKLYPLDYISKKVEQYATRMLLSAAGTDSSLAQSTEAVSKEASFSSQLPQHGVLTTNKMNAADPLSLSGSSVSSPEAKRLMSLYFFLCTKRPSLLRLVFDVYGQAPKIVKQEFLYLMPILTGASGPSSPELLNIISDPPSGSEDLLRLVLELLMKSPPSPNLITTVIHLYETKLKDATILIPMLSSLSKHEVLPIFPRLVDLPLDKFEKALDPILQGSAHSGPALTPVEALVALHDIVMDACSACFEQRMVFTEQVLAKALSQMVERNPLPLLLMRTVIQAIDAYPTLVDFVMEILSKLVVKQIWKMPKLWVGFMKCVSQTQPHSFRVLLQLPPPQLENALNKSISSVLGLSVEHLQRPRAPSHLNAPDTSSSVQGATLT
ncbi:Symplekin-like protein, partial [Drosera capensis]